MSMTIPALRPSSLPRVDAQGLGALYDTHGRQLFRLAYRLLGTREDAEDVLHDVFVGLPEALAHYEERGRFDAWLRRVTVRVALMHQRTRKRRREARLDGAAAVPTSPGLTAEQIELQAAVNALPAELRSVLVLKEMEGYSHAEIATLLGISPVTARVRLFRAMRSLRQRLEDHQ